MVEKKEKEKGSRSGFGYLKALHEGFELAKILKYLGALLFSAATIGGSYYAAKPSDPVKKPEVTGVVDRDITQEEVKQIARHEILAEKLKLDYRFNKFVLAMERKEKEDIKALECNYHKDCD